MKADGAAIAKEWFTPRELAAEKLPDMPHSQPGIFDLADREEWRRPEWKDVRWRVRKGRGKGFQYHYSVLRPYVQAALVAKHALKATEVEEKLRALERQDYWRAFQKASEKKKKKALHKLAVVRAYQALCLSGDTIADVVSGIKTVFGVPQSTLYRWVDEARTLAPADQLAMLMPRHAGRGPTRDWSAEAWDWLMADYLRPERPTFSDCLRRLREKNTKDGMGWALPSDGTLLRRVRSLSPAMVTYFRQGHEAGLRMYPAQERDRSIFHALEAINGDGHKWDVAVRWPDGTVARPMMVAFQDLYSGLVLSWRMDRTENKETVRLALGDVFETYGIPRHCWLDNGKGFASKWITGRTPNRYRFKIRDEDPEGLLTALDVKVHWTKPYSGQSKPIERAFRDLAESLAKHPKFAGAYMGNNPMNKPENYGSKAVDLAVFMAVIEEGIVEHNNRVGRRSRVCDGRLSFAQAFAASYATAPITKAGPEQKQLWLMAGEAVRVNRRDGAIEIAGNRYWSDILLPEQGKTVTVRFDPLKLHEPLHVYRMDGVYLGEAACQIAAGFADVAAARAHAQQRAAWLRGLKQMREAEGKMTIAQLADAMPAAERSDPVPEPKVVRPLFGVRGAAALQATIDAAELDDEVGEHERMIVKFSEMRRGGKALRVVEGDDD